MMQQYMIVLAYLGSLCAKFHTAGCLCWFLKYFCLESCIWPDVISQWTQQQMCIKFHENLGKCETETLAMIRQAFREEDMTVNGCLNGKVQTHQD
jgi:hypothetical protein